MWLSVKTDILFTIFKKYLIFLLWVYVDNQEKIYILYRYFFQALTKFKKELVDDPIIKAHLNTLYDTMLEQNLCRIIEPYSRVQVSF